MPFMEKKRRFIQNAVLLCAMFVFLTGNMSAQENYIHFSVINDTAHLDDKFEVDSLGELLNIDENTQNFDMIDHGNGLLFTYFKWMPGYRLYQNFDIVNVHYRHIGSASPDTLILGNYVHPAQYRITSNYGYRHGRKHRGVDLGYPIGTPVMAVFDGMVRISKGNNTGGYGNLIVIRHNNGLETYYAHLSRRLVNPGQIVHAGDIIGFGGNTGRSYGAHLHFEIRYLGMDINPNRIIDFNEYKLKYDTLYISGYSVSTKTPPFDDGTDTQQSAPIYHRVRRGDCLGKIAIRYHTSISRIKKLNHLRSDNIREGSRLRVR